MKRHGQDMVRGPLAQGILLYSIPVILTSCLQLLFNAADLVVVGRFCGSISVAAVGSTGAVTNLIINLFMGLSVGAGVTVAHAMGAREGETVRRTIGTSVLMALVGGAVLTVIGVLISPTLLRLMAAPEDVLPLSSTYMRVYFCGMIFNLLYNYAASILRAAGDTRTPLIILTAAGVLNVFLNIWFVVSFQMNVAGVALATVLSQALTAAAVVVVLLRRQDDCVLLPGYIRIYPAQLRNILRIGLPAGIQGAMFSISNVIIQSSINSFGSVLVSGNAAVSNLESFCYVTVNGFHQAAVNYIGQNLGAQRYDRIPKIIRLSLGYAALFGMLIGGGMYVLRVQLLGIYITDSPEAVELGAVRMAATTLPYLLFGLQDVESGILRGFGRSTSAMVLSVAGICGVRLIWIATIFQQESFHTPTCLYLSYPISWVITGLAAAVVVYHAVRSAGIGSSLTE